jgi:hypothetical protein
MSPLNNHEPYEMVSERTGEVLSLFSFRQNAPYRYNGLRLWRRVPTKEDDVLRNKLAEAPGYSFSEEEEKFYKFSSVRVYG